MRYYTYRRQVPLIHPGDRLGYKRGKGYYVIAAPTPPAPPTTAASVFSGRGAFTTSEPGATHGHPCDWVALQADPEGNLNSNGVPGRICWWEARPRLQTVEAANHRGIPYIAQAENLYEIKHALELGPKIAVPHALVGNLRLLVESGYGAQALALGFDGIAEWYWNAHPWEQPDGGNYPRFVNVCFGIYSEGEPGGDGYVPQSKTVTDYRAVWHGSFSVWKAEAMTGVDWAGFAA